jgi:hypothetical protein
MFEYPRMQNPGQKERRLLDEADNCELIANLTDDVGRRSCFRKAAVELRGKAARLRAGIVDRERPMPEQT